MTTGGALKLALVGCGRHALESHAPAMARYATAYPGQIEMTAACDSDKLRAEQFCRDFGFGVAYDDLAALIRDTSPQACICVLPPDQTSMLGSQLLAQSTPCLLEVPLGDDLDEALEMADAAAEFHTPHLVSMNRRFNRYLTQAVAWAKHIGPIQAVQATLKPDGPIDPLYVRFTALHAVDALAYLLGRVEGSNVAVGDNGAPSISLQFPNGVTGRLVLHPTAPQSGEVYELTGERYRAVATLGGPDGQSLRCWVDDQLAVDIRVPSDQPADEADGTYAEFTAFIECIREGQSPRPAIEDVMPAVDVSEQLAAHLQPAPT